MTRRAGRTDRGGASCPPRPPGVPRPPFTNRGVTVATETPNAPTTQLPDLAWAGVHWLQGSTRLPPSEVVATLEHLLDGGFVSGSRGGNTYSNSLHGPAGVKIYLTPGRPECLVVLPGEVCEQLGVAGLVSAATLCEVKPTRVDLAWDTTLTTPGRVRDEFLAGNVVTRAHRDSWDWRENAEGATFYIGSRSSERLVRFYDRRGPTRMEFEVKGDRAPLLWAHLLEHEEADWSSAGMACLRDYLDFRDRSSEVEPRACPLLPWWETIVAGAGRKALTIPRKVRTMAKAAAVVEYQWSATVAMVADSQPDPEGYLLSLLDLGRDRRRQHHVVTLAEYRASG